MNRTYQTSTKSVDALLVFSSISRIDAFKIASLKIGQIRYRTIRKDRPTRLVASLIETSVRCFELRFLAVNDQCSDEDSRTMLNSLVSIVWMSWLIWSTSGVKRCLKLFTSVMTLESAIGKKKVSFLVRHWTIDVSSELSVETPHYLVFIFNVVASVLCSKWIISSRLIADGRSTNETNLCLLVCLNE